MSGAVRSPQASSGVKTTIVSSNIHGLAGNTPTPGWTEIASDIRSIGQSFQERIADGPGNLCAATGHHDPSLELLADRFWDRPEQRL